MKELIFGMSFTSKKEKKLNCGANGNVVMESLSCRNFV